MAQDNAAIYRFLRKFQTQLRKAPDSVLKKVSRQLAAETLDRVKEGFRSERDPYSKKWKEKKVDDRRKVLSGRTGRLKQYQVKSLGTQSFTVGPIVNYARYHQTGTRYMVARKMVPDERGIPKSWERDFEEIIVEVLEDHFTPKR